MEGYNELVAEAAQSGKLEKIVTLAKRQKELEGAIAKLEKETKEQRGKLIEELERISGGFKDEGMLPVTMKEAGLSEFILDDGSKIKISDDLIIPSVGEKGKYRDAIFAWLRKSGNANIIKSTIIVPFSKDDIAKADLLAEALEKGIGVEYGRTETVAAPSFKKLIDEMLQDGDEIPMEELGIQSFHRSEVILPE